MKNRPPYVPVAIVALLSIFAIWLPEYNSWTFGTIFEVWRETATVVVVGFAGFLIVYRWHVLKDPKRTEVPGSGGNVANPEELNPPYPEPTVLDSISAFRYESDLKLMRLKNGLPEIDRDAQYVVTKDYKVSFDLSGERRSITVPRGTLTDFASVPRPFRIMIGRVGPHLEASIVHDYQYVAWQQNGLAPNERMRCFADELMLVAMNAAGMGSKARLIYWAVRLFGCIAFFSKNPEPLILPEDRLPACCCSGDYEHEDCD